MVELIETRKIATESIQFKQEFYPREKPRTATIEQYVDGLRAGNVFPPIDLDQDGLILLDGYHRWKAHVEAGIPEIEARIVALNGTPRLLYAAGQNSKHGDRLSNAEKRLVAREMAMLDGIRQVDVQRELHVSAGKVSEWVSDITQKKQRKRDGRIWWLHRLGWTQEEIGDRVGLSQPGTHKTLLLCSDLKKVIIDQSSRGHSPEQIALAEDVSPGLVEALLLDGKDDEQRLEYLKIGSQPYDVWSFAGCDPRYGNDYPGRIPGQMLINLLYFFTQPGNGERKDGDLIIDPMAGSGTTVDACAMMGRRVYAFDAHPVGDRKDIIEHDLSEGWPERTAQAQLIFWDPPYFRKKDDGYGEKSISRLDKADYLAFFEHCASNIPAKFSGRMAFLCSDFNEEDNSDQNIFFWDYINIFSAAGWVPERRIQVPLSTQQVHPDIVKRFRKDRRLARLNRDLVIMKKG